MQPLSKLLTNRTSRLHIQRLLKHTEIYVKECKSVNDLISIVIPVYNMGESVEKSVRSVLKQDYGNIEVILVDDGSSDNSLEICKALQKQDSRIRVFHTENRGSGPARNTGIQNAGGSYVYFPDADDCLKENALSVMMDKTENGKFDLIVFGYESINENGKTVFEKTFPETDRLASDLRADYSQCMGGVSRLAIQGAPWNKFFSMRIIRENNVEYPPLRRHQDEGFISRYMCFAENVRFIPDILYTHFVNSLKLEWKKYPVNYYDCITGLNKVRQETIMTWNKNDRKTHDMITRELICGLIKSMELLYSDKAGLDRRGIRNGVLKLYAMLCERVSYIPDILGKYQRLIIKLLQKNMVTAAMAVLHFKVFMEKTNIAFWR